MGWQNNPIMEWSDDGAIWFKVPDHGRAPLSISVERIEQKTRMGGGTLRKYVIAKKKNWTTSWENLPDKTGNWLASGESGQWIEDWHDSHDGDFYMRLRDGASNFEVYTVMISDFSKEVVKRTPNFDLWTLDITIEEV